MDRKEVGTRTEMVLGVGRGGKADRGLVWSCLGVSKAAGVSPSSIKLICF